jgi:antitoxin component YwqK of YwqJK toxin-antitoxin module
MAQKNLISLASKVIAIFLIAIIFSSCSKGDKEIISFYENGSPKLIYFTKTKNGVKEKVFEQMYYENGKLQYVGNFINNEKTGKWEYYFQNGTLFSKCDYTNSKSGFNWEVYKMDKTKLVNKNDKVEEVTFYVEGGLAAIRVKNQTQEKEYRFFPSYRLMEERELKGNILNGQILSFYENGNINSKNYFKDGMQDSIYILYYENGKVQIKGNYKMDNKIGKWEYFKEDGSFDGDELYTEDGSIIKPRNSGMKYFDKDGNQIMI